MSSEHMKGMAQEYKAERDEFENEVLALRSQNAELVEALRELADGIFDHLKAGTVRCDICQAAYKSARAALARVKP